MSTTFCRKEIPSFNYGLKNHFINVWLHTLMGLQFSPFICCLLVYLHEKRRWALDLCPSSACITQLYVLYPILSISAMALRLREPRVLHTQWPGWDKPCWPWRTRRSVISFCLCLLGKDLPMASVMGSALSAAAHQRIVSRTAFQKMVSHQPGKLQNMLGFLMYLTHPVPLLHCFPTAWKGCNPCPGCGVSTGCVK